MSKYLSRDPRFDDSSYYRFERNSRIPHGTFDYETWWTRLPHRLVFWIPAIGLTLALILRW